MTERGNGVVVPLVGAHVGEVILGRPVPLAGIVGQQAEEDRCDLRTGDPAVRADRTVGVANQIGIVILGIETCGGDDGRAARSVDEGLHRIGNRGLGEFLGLDRGSGAVLCVQNGIRIGEQGLFCLCFRERFFAIQILHTVSAGSGFGIGQLDGIGQLNWCKVGDVLVDGPDEGLRIRSVLHLETEVFFVQIFGTISEIGHVALRLGFQLRAADSQLQRTGDKIERIAYLVLHCGTGTNGVKNVVLDGAEIHPAPLT